MTSQPATAPAALSSAELTLIAGFLESAVEDFSQHSGNDFTLPATGENKAIFIAVLEHHDKCGDTDHAISAEEINAETDEVFIYDFWAMDYFAVRCAKLAKSPGTSAPSQAELFALSDLLAYVYEDHESSSDSVDHDVSLPSSGEHRPILAETIKLFRTVEHPEEYGQEVAAKLASIVPAFLSGGEVRIPDFWIMYHLALKCRAVSGSDKPLYEEFDQAKWDADETEWAKGYVPTAEDLRAEELRKEVRELARTRFKKTRAANTLARERYLSMLILADTEAERDALYADKAFVSGLELIRKKATLQGFEVQCFAFMSQEAVDAGDSNGAVWWFEDVCPQIRYDRGLSARDKAIRLGVSQEILDLAAKTEGAAPADAEESVAPDAEEEPEAKGPIAFLRKHWLVVGFFAFFLAVLIFGKGTGTK